jgi:hypothetical protein
MEHVNQLASSSLITGYYDQQDAIFWNNLAKDSTAYLYDNTPFPKEGNNIIYCSFLSYDHSFSK